MLCPFRLTSLARLGRTSVITAMAIVSSTAAVADGTASFTPRDGEAERQVASSDLEWSVTRNELGKAVAGDMKWRSPLDPLATAALYRNFFPGRPLLSLTHTQHGASGSLAPSYTLSSAPAGLTGLSQTSTELTVTARPTGLQTLSLDPAAHGSHGGPQSVAWDVARQVVTSSGLSAARAIESSNVNRTFASGSFSTYIRLGDNRGFSTDIGYENWTEVNDFSFDFQSLFANVPGTNSAVANPPSASPFKWTQEIDQTTLFSLQQMVRGQSIPEVVVEVVANGEGVRSTVRQIVLKNASVNSIQLSGDTVTESLTFSSFRETLWTTDPNGAGVRTPLAFEYDFVRRVPSANIGAIQSPLHFGSGNLDRVALPTASQVQAVPEPGSFALAASAVALLMGWQRRNKAARA